jgi:hypothetical protein
MNRIHYNPRCFVEAVFQLPPEAYVNGNFRTEAQGSLPRFFPLLAQDAIERRYQSWFFSFQRGDLEPENRCIGGYIDPVEGATQLVALGMSDPMFYVAKRPSRCNSDDEALRLYGEIARMGFVPDIGVGNDVLHFDPDGLVTARLIKDGEITRAAEMGMVSISGDALIARPSGADSDIRMGKKYELVV